MTLLGTTVLAPLVATIPLLFAAIILLIGHFVPKRVPDAVGIATAVTTAILGLFLLAHEWGHGIVYWFGGWTPRSGSFPVGISFVFDGFGSTLVVFVALLVSAALVYSWRYMEESRHLYEVLMLLFGGAMAGFAMSGDLFNMFVFFELMSVVAFALTAYNVEEPSAIQGGFNFAITNAIGGFLVLAGIALVYGRTGSLNLAEIGKRLEFGGRHDGLVIVAFTLVTCGFLVKAAIVPFHFWLADAHAIAPAPVCLLFSGVMVELGLYGVARVFWVCFSQVLGEFDGPIRDVFLGLGAVTAIVGAVMCVLQRHVKRLLAYSTISHSGCFLIGLGLLSADGLAGVGMYTLAHGLAKGALFLIGGIMLVRLDSVDELVLHGRGRVLRWSGAMWLVAAVALASPPFLGTWQGHSLIEDSATVLGYWWVAPLISLATILSTGAILRAGARVFLGAGPRDDEVLSEQPEESREDDEGRPSLTVMQGVVTVLAVGALVLGAVTPLGANAMEAAHRFTDARAYQALVLDHRAFPPSPPGHWITTTASVVWGLLTVAGSFVVAVVLLYRSRVFDATLGRVAAPLKALHSGHAGDYVAWLAFGVAVVGGLFAVAIR